MSPFWIFYDEFFSHTFTALLSISLLVMQVIRAISNELISCVSFYSLSHWESAQQEKHITQSRAKHGTQSKAFGTISPHSAQISFTICEFQWTASRFVREGKWIRRVLVGVYGSRTNQRSINVKKGIDRVKTRKSKERTRRVKGDGWAVIIGYVENWKSCALWVRCVGVWSEL